MNRKQELESNSNMHQLSNSTTEVNSKVNIESNNIKELVSSIKMEASEIKSEKYQCSDLSENESDENYELKDEQIYNDKVNMTHGSITQHGLFLVNLGQRLRSPQRSKWLKFNKFTDFSKTTGRT